MLRVTQLRGFGRRAEAAAAPGLPNISIVGVTDNDGSGNTVTIPAGHQAGDLMVMVALHPDSTTPAAPAGQGWSLKVNRTGFSKKNFRVYQKFATSSSETSGDWSGSNGLHCHVYRNAGGIGASDVPVGGATDSFPQVPGLSLDVTNGSSWVMAFVMQVTDSTTDLIIGSGMTARTTIIRTTGTDFRSETWDTNGGVSSFASRTAANSNLDWQAAAIEILKATS